MNEVIISPYLIYMLDIVDKLNSFIFALWGLMVGVIIVSTVRAFVEAEKLVFSKWFLILFTAISILLVFLPSRTTIIQMMISKHITYGTLQEAKDIISNVYSDILKLTTK